MSDAGHSHDSTHSYFDWQVSTLMLAYDVVDPVSRDDLAAQQARQQRAEEEVRDLALAAIPEEFQRDETRELTPEVVMQMTRSTLKRASEIVGLL